MRNAQEMINDADKVLAQHLENIRKDRGDSLEQVSIASGISRATLSRIERGETSPTANVLGRLCSAYRITMSQLLMAVEADTPRLKKFSQAQKWRDPATGFERVALSPPAECFDIEIALGELPVMADIEYGAPPVEGLEQHIVLLIGQLNLTFDGDNYEMEPFDCLSLKLQGVSRFQNKGDEAAKYLIINRKAL